MLVDNLLASLVNISTFYVISYPYKYPLWFCYACNQAYLFLYNIMAILFLLYVDSKTKIRSIKKLVGFFATVIMVYDGVLIFTTHLTKLLIYFDDSLNYHHGPMMISLYVTAFIAVSSADVLILAKRKMFNFYQVFTINIFAVGVFVAVIFQVLHPKFVISNFVVSMVLFFLYTAFENQAYYLHGDTPCYNRRAFIKTIDWYRKREEKYLLAIIKIGDFENIKHSLGRIGVDDLAERIAEMISRRFGKAAYYVDINGFVVLEDDPGKAYELVQNIKDCFVNSINLEFDEEIIPVNIEPVITIVKVNGKNIEGYEMCEIVQKADDNLTVGTEVIVRDADDLIKPVRREKEILRLVDTAIKEKGFKVFYQPILDVKAGSFTCAEALVRLYDDELGFISPEEFIPISEKNGRIIDIGDYVFRNVCSFIKEHNITSLGVHYIEINLSPEQCKKVELADQLIQIAIEYGVDFRQINLEITETAEMENYGMVSMNEIITMLHNKGITFSLDDFGSGFAAIDYLIKLPVDIVKIDKGILWQAMKDSKSMTILRNTIRMIKEVGKQIVVEGIETKEMADILIENGCDYLQGYLYSKPVSEAEYLEFLKKNNSNCSLQL